VVLRHEQIINIGDEGHKEQNEKVPNGIFLKLDH